MQYGITFVFKNGVQHDVHYDTKEEKDAMLQAYVEDFLSPNVMGTCVNEVTFRFSDVLFIIDVELTDDEVEKLKAGDKNALN